MACIYCGRMKKLLVIIVLLTCLGIYISKNAFHYSPIALNILNDIMAIPVILLFLDSAMRTIYGNKFKMNLGLVLLTFITISVLFEVFFPLLSNTVVADPADVAWYLLGSLIYSGIQYKNIDRTIWKSTLL